MGTAEYMTPDTGQMRQPAVHQSCVLTAEGRRTLHKVTWGGATGNRVNDQEASSIVSRGWGDSWFPQKDVIRLLIPCTGKEPKPASQG